MESIAWPFLSASNSANVRALMELDCVNYETKKNKERERERLREARQGVNDCVNRVNGMAIFAKTRSVC